MAPLGVSLTTETYRQAERIHVCQCVYVYFKVFANVGSGVRMLLCVSHCVCICACLLMSLGALEDFWLHPCDTVRV